MGLLDRMKTWRKPGNAVVPAAEERFAIDQWITDYLLPANQFNYGSTTYPFGFSTGLVADRTREISNTLPAYMAALRYCPPAFAAQLVRGMVLSQARFIFRTRSFNSNPRKLFGSRALATLDRPWPNGTTGELITRMEWHAGLAGNAYVTNWQPGRLRVLRPDWVVIVYGSQQEPEDAAFALDGDLLGYIYCNGGLLDKRNPLRFIDVNEMAHWAPLPDPEHAGLGMSWLTPAIREIQADRAMTDHKQHFFSNGAPQPLSAKILTPGGWSTMGEMRTGSRVIGSDGKAHDVVAVYPQGERDIYRVDFADGTSTECTLDHIWTVSNNYDRQRGLTRTRTLGDLIEDGFQYPSGSSKWAVPMVDPVEYDPVSLPLDPYFLGLLLGDGSFRGSRGGGGTMTLACARGDTDETIRNIENALPEEMKIGRRDRGGWSELNFTGPWRVVRRPDGPIARHLGNPLTRIIKDLGLFGLLGRDKFVPEVYLRAPVKDRVAILQGLIDSDGSVEPTGLRFTTTSRRLAGGVVELVGSLGGVATVQPNKGRTTLTVTIRQLPAWIVPVRLSRKAEQYAPTSALRARTMVGAEFVRREAAQCIAVDSSDHLYATDDFILTHNTPSMIVSGITAPDRQRFEEIVDAIETKHSGVRNAYRTLYLTQGADAKVVGSDLHQMDFRNVQSLGETRIASLSRVHPTILGFSEGLTGSSLNAGNFAAARRLFADSWIYPTLQDLAASLSPIVAVPPDAELWFDTVDMPILREDALDAAKIEDVKAVTITKYVVEGFTPKSAVAAVNQRDVTLLEHSGLLSVQLQPPGGFDVNQMPPPGGEPAPAKPAPAVPAALKPSPPKPAPPKSAKP